MPMCQASRTKLVRSWRPRGRERSGRRGGSMVSRRRHLGFCRPICDGKRGGRFPRRPPELFHVKQLPLGAVRRHLEIDPTSRFEDPMSSPAKQSASSVSASDKEAALALTPVSRETEARLDRYVALLVEWQTKTNLVSPSTLPHLWTRHISDSLQLSELAPTAKVWADLGSGGGFPGVVLACALAGISGAEIHLVERNAKKAAFLREALRVTNAPGIVHLADIGDNVDSLVGRVDCLTARALAPLP